MSAIEPRAGGCLCRAVRYTVADLPHHLHACHCTICRRISGSATISISAQFASMQLMGRENIVSYVSSDWAERSFCGRCGSGLWYRLTGVEEADYILSAGTLDDLTGLVLTQEIHVENKPDGYAFAGDHPRLTGAEFEATLNANSKE